MGDRGRPCLSAEDEGLRSAELVGTIGTKLRMASGSDCVVSRHEDVGVRAQVEIEEVVQLRHLHLEQLLRRQHAH